MCVSAGAADAIANKTTLTGAECFLYVNMYVCMYVWVCVLR